ncbi:protein SPA1-RELATED 4 isoform X2 [Cryptomeria japonica]|uniref:protein SPA1-RELATED 4 isoform X2 n=1 Tax=Cryptomeria japonica TaxID=3369 RepID=UPI0025ABF54E|nr:protein SPA1-RELATED 4 isoform X2 [Cryptomeria japonica]
MDKVEDEEMHSEQAKVCEFYGLESPGDPDGAGQIYPLQSPPEPHSSARNLSSIKPDENQFGFIERGSNLGLKEDETESGGVTLRQWLTRPHRIVNRFQCLLIFAQVVEVINAAHSRGLVLENLRPSCLRISSFSRVSITEFVKSSENIVYNGRVQGHAQPDRSRAVQKSSRDFGQYRRGHQTLNLNAYYDGNHDKNATSVAMASSSRAMLMKKSPEARDMEVEHDEESNPEKYGSFQPNQISHMELTWYTIPEEQMGVPRSFSSNLFCTFSSDEEQWRIMSDLRHRIPPPHLLRKWPKEITFCLLLLHPEPNQRPKLSEVLQSEIMNEAREILLEWKAAGKLQEEIADRELLLDFLIQVQQQKQETAEKLYEAVACVTSDIEVVLHQQSSLKHKGVKPFDFTKEKLLLKRGKKPSCLSPHIEQNDGTNITNRTNMLNIFPDKTGKTIMLGKRFQKGCENDGMNIGKKLGKSNLQSESKGDFIERSDRMLKDFKELEKVYFSTRGMEKQLASDSSGKCFKSSLGQGPVIRTGGSNISLVNSLASISHPSGGSKTGRLGSFFDSLCKYLRFSKFKVKATLRQGDLLNSSSLVCSLSFDRDKEYFATAGVSKKIKVFDCDTVLDEVLDIHYPVTEMTSRSKLSSICWNSYIKNQIASSCFDGMVQLWDITRNQAIMDFEEHKRRVWSVDFSQTDPRQLASGGDDCYVKLWNINQGGSIGTVRTNANVCCVQFPPDSPYLLALGCADYKIYCYDLRNTKKPWCFLANHKRTVSYVKFLDSSNIVSASTDSTLKLWDLARSTGGVLSNPVRTFAAHKNEKNFVGLSAADGYIATGSESNEVFVYHRSISLPVACYNFNCMDITNDFKVDDDTGQYVSSVCWRGQSQTLVAANSKGTIKILEMV